MRRIRRDYKDLGEIRTSQLVTSYGVGAIVDFKNETAILGEADDWYSYEEKDNDRILRCHNLEKILKKDFFVRPKCDTQNKAFYKKSISHDIGAYRFPKVLYCPACTRLYNENQLGGFQNGELKCPNCKKRLVPSRFVVICRRGHIDDFPYFQWVHRGSLCEKSRDGQAPKLRLFNINGRTNLGSLMVSCEDCGKIRSMQEAFVPDALSSVYKCKGNQPWLNQMLYNYYCNERAVVRMRNSTGVYMPVNISALNIPPWNTKISKILLSHLDALDGKNEAALLSYIKNKIQPCLPNVSVEKILEIYKALISEQKFDNPSTTSELYEEEYQALCIESKDFDSDFCSRHIKVPNKYSEFIDTISAIDRLTEIVAMVGFTRLQGWDGDINSPCLAPIFKAKRNWFPAIDMHGEGIFIRLNEEKVAVWEKQNQAIYKPMMDNIKENNFHCENASARYVLLHTIAHLFIRSLANLCGYQTSSLKERIYSTYTNGKEMAGILIYTASSDTEGSLGGLVAQAETMHIEEIFDALLNEAEWCSGDPLCMTSTGINAQGLFGLNYAACHQCTLLPETSCTMRNLLLDRAALIGRLEDKTVGYFKNIQKNI